MRSAGPVAVHRESPSLLPRQPGPCRYRAGYALQGRAIGRAAAPADLRLDEVVEFAVENGRDVAGLEARPRVLDELVRMQDVVAHLRVAAETDGVARPLELVELVGLSLAAQFEQLRLQHLERPRAVLQLAALVLAGHDDVGRDVRQTHRRVRRVDALAAGTARPVDVDADLVL